MLMYMYVPSSNKKFIDECELLVQGRVNKGKAPYELIIKNNNPIKKSMAKYYPGILSTVTPDDRLYVAGHGSWHSTHIGCYMDNGEMKSYNAIEFATHLKSEGLSSDFVDLRIFTCYSGLAPNRDGFNEPFVQQLAMELRKIGFFKIKVTGYLGMVQPQYFRRLIDETRHRTLTPHKGVYSEARDDYFAASKRKVIF